MAGTTRLAPHGVPIGAFPSAAAFTPSMSGFRFYFRGDEDDTTAVAAEDTNASMASNNRPGFQFRAQIQETGGLSGEVTDDWQVQYKLNAGSFTNVTNSSSVCRSSSMAITDGEATTERLTAGTGSFLAGIARDAAGTVDNFQLTANNYTELCWGLQLQDGDLAEDDTVEFRVLRNGSPIAQTVTPVLTVQDFNWDFDAFRFYEDGTESGAVAAAAEDTNIVRDPGADPDFQLRYRLQASNGINGSEIATDDDWRPRVSLNGGGFSFVSAVSYINNNASSALTDNGATTQRLSAGTGSFVAGKQEESTGSGVTNGNSITANNHTENVNAFSLVDAQLSNNDTIDFEMQRLVANVQSDTGRTLTVVPRITISK